MDNTGLPFPCQFNNAIYSNQLLDQGDRIIDSPGMVNRPDRTDRVYSQIDPLRESLTVGGAD